MKQADKNRETRFTNFPKSIGWVLKIAGVAVGYYLWGWDFTWAVAGLVFCWGIIKAIASCLISLICLGGLLWFLFTHIF